MNRLAKIEINIFVKGFFTAPAETIFRISRYLPNPHRAAGPCNPAGSLLLVGNPLMGGKSYAVLNRYDLISA